MGGEGIIGGKSQPFSTAFQGEDYRNFNDDGMETIKFSMLQ
jgi:hypothetical protein